MHTGLVFNVQRFCLQDGPGLRTTAFLKGCPLSCAWCHNPEGRSPQIQFVRLCHRCMRCGRCDEAELARSEVSGRSERDADSCPTGALQSVGERFDSQSLVQILLRDRIFFDESGGGVTISGGEPLLQAAFVTETLQLLRSEGVHTALDTSGFAEWEDLRDAAAHASIILYDLKVIDDDRHKFATGVSNRSILRNLTALCSLHSNVRIRIPVIPGVNDDSANLEATAAFLRPLRGITQVDLLPYHPTGELKFSRVGLTSSMQGAVAPSVERLDFLAAPIRETGIPTTIGGQS